MLPVLVAKIHIGRISGVLTERIQQNMPADRVWKRCIYRQADITIGHIDQIKDRSICVDLPTPVGISQTKQVITENLELDIAAIVVAVHRCANSNLRLVQLVNGHVRQCANAEENVYQYRSTHVVRSQPVATDLKELMCNVKKDVNRQEKKIH